MTNSSTQVLEVFRRVSVVLATLTAIAVLSGCSIRKMAINKIGDALSSGPSTYESDDDIQLVGDALPFGLKLIESLVAEAPRHKGLHLSACRGFTSYSQVYVRHAADMTALTDLDEGERQRARAKRLFMRGLQYCLSGLEASYPGVSAALEQTPQLALSKVKKKDVPLLFWSAASLGLAISAGKNQAAMVGRIPEVEALIQKAIELDESWERGALHEFQVAFLSSKPGATDYAAIEHHYHRALELSAGKSASLYVAYAEAVSIPKQDRRGFEELLNKSLEVDRDASKEARLVNAVAQQRAQWLLEHSDDFILSTPDETGKENANQ